MNRYIRHTDPRRDEIDGLSLYNGEAWHFRPWEYTWALSQLDGSVVLDAGSGVTHPLQFLLALRCDRVLAVDTDPRLADRPPFGGLDRVVASLCEMPIEDESVDQVFCISVLEHLSPGDRAAALREFRRVLRPGGSVVLTMDCPRVLPGTMILDAAAAGLTPRGDVELDEHPDDVVFDWRGELLRVFRCRLERG